MYQIKRTNLFILYDENVAKNSQKPNLNLSYNELKLRKRYYSTGDFLLYNIQRADFYEFSYFYLSKTAVNIKRYEILYD